MKWKRCIYNCFRSHPDHYVHLFNNMEAELIVLCSPETHYILSHFIVQSITQCVIERPLTCVQPINILNQAFNSYFIHEVPYILQDNVSLDYNLSSHLVLWLKVWGPLNHVSTVILYAPPPLFKVPEGEKVKIIPCTVWLCIHLHLPWFMQSRL